MKNFKYGLFSIIVLVLLTFIGYWAVSSIESGSSHLDNQKLKELTEENEDLKEEISSLKNEIIVLRSQVEEQVKVSQEPEVIKEETKPTESVTLKYQSLINDLQKIVDEKIIMKKGSKGTRVGTVQKFLNIYNNTSNRIDNDYGSSMETAIKNFQKSQGLTADGEAGPGTFRKMIDWLKKQ